MKLFNILFSFFLLIAFFSCKEKAREKNLFNGFEFTVSGTINNLQNPVVSVEGQNGIGSDTADADGNFKITYKTPEPDYFALRVDNQYIKFIADAEKIEVTADAGNLMNSVSIQGSPSTAHYLEFQKEMIKREQRKMELEQKFETERKVNNATAMKELQEEYQLLQDNTKQFVKSSVEKALPGIAVFSMLFEPKDYRSQETYLNFEEDYDFLVEVCRKLTDQIPQSKYTKMYTAQIAQLQEMKEKEKHSKVAPGKPAPEISLPSPEGETISLSSLRGKYVLIDFWASWCGPCRAENPNVVSVYKKYRDKGFEIYGVSLDNSKEAWVNAIKKDGILWPQVSDLKGWQSSIAPVYEVTGIPATFLLDKDGVIIAKNLRGKQLEEKLKEVMGN
ncbi:MAG: redoxin domain-containing protein [Cytophagaceae bacterium]